MAPVDEMMTSRLQVGILTVSDTRSRGTRADTATPRIKRILEKAGFTVAQARLVPDEIPKIQKQLIDFSDRLKFSLILTTGGTGFGPRDVTPEATACVIKRAVPGIPEAMRLATARRRPHAWLSRGIAGLRRRTLIINLPGNPQGVEECLQVLLPLLPHALEMIRGEDHGHVKHLDSRR